MSLTLIYIKADELLYTLPVLELSGAVAGILTWLSKGALSFSHFLVHPSQTQPRRRKRRKVLVSFATWHGSPIALHPKSTCQPPLVQATGDRGHTYKVTMSALAAWTAMLRGSCPSSSTACWLAPRFRNKQTWLQKGKQRCQSRCIHPQWRFNTHDSHTGGNSEAQGLSQDVLLSLQEKALSLRSGDRRRGEQSWGPAGLCM